MLETWVLFTVAAAFFQNFRSALQKHLKSQLTTAGASYVRFLYCWPFALLYCWGVATFSGQPLPTPNGKFLLYCLLGGLSQILFTFFLVWLFSFRNFAVGTTFSKTETVQVAILGLVLLGDTLSLAGIVAIAVSMLGVMILSATGTRVTATNLLAGMADKATLIGIASGAFLGASVVFFRGAALSLGEGDFLMRAAFALAVAVTMQTAIMGAYLLVREPGQMTAVFVSWKWSLPVGIAGVLSSIGWFTAFTLEKAAYVRALGQIELVFTFAASLLFFKEKTTAAEIAGIGMIIAGILILLLAR